MTSITRRQPVTLTPAELDHVCKVLNFHAAHNHEAGRKTKSAAIRAYAIDQAEASGRLEASIVRRMYTTDTIEGNI